MAAFPALPLFSREDPEQSSEGGLDPLGLVVLAEALAGRLAPGVRERMSRARFLTALAVSREVCRDGDEDAPGLESWLAFELYLVEALVRGPRGADTERLLGLPGSLKARDAVAAGLPLAPSRYLKNPAIIGFHGVYKTLAVALEHERGEERASRGTALVECWAQEQGLAGFTGGSGRGADFRRQLAGAVEEARSKKQTDRSQAWTGWKFFPDYLHPDRCGASESALLRADLRRDGTGFRAELWDYLNSSAGRGGTEMLFRSGKANVDEREFHRALAEGASPALRAWLEMVSAFETFSRLLTNAWLRLLGDLARENSPRDAAHLGKSSGLQRIASQLPAAWRECQDRWLADEVSLLWRQRCSQFGEAGSGADLVERLVAHHRAIQQAKPPAGKRPWVDDAGGGRLAARQLYSDLHEPAAPDRYVHAYRLRPLYSFACDLRHAR